MFTRYSFGVFLSVLLVTSSSSPSQAVDIPTNRLESNPLTLKVVPGKATTLHFDNGEVIEHFVVSDDSQLIYNTNQPPGQATTFILRQTEEIQTPGATTTSEPNIIINTRSSNGDTNVYQVVVQFAKIVPDSELLWRVIPPSYSPTEQTVDTALGQANLKHLQLGLAHLLSTGQLNNDDEITKQLRTLFVKAKFMTLDEAAHQANVPLQVLNKLGEIGLKAQSEKLNFLVPLVRQGVPSIKIGEPVDSSDSSDSSDLSPQKEE
ncbi:hypothetical protein [Crocosphaera chwakensis]|uniref:Uncharacterized protein n=1 Tax=Crocosphaera chwakensis CCY0110 TaxID=391612 RepID=A3IZA4_9CHRO|nr:hypothetical protein [Crocosphaera chwakensis]EAZ88195.1 hypothetical protein CY0110_14680 [Crocosphaera chwakensis CCY0110]